MINLYAALNDREQELFHKYLNEIDYHSPDGDNYWIIQTEEDLNTNWLDLREENEDGWDGAKMLGDNEIAIFTIIETNESSTNYIVGKQFIDQFPSIKQAVIKDETL